MRNKKIKPPRADIKKRVASALLAGTMAVTSMFSNLGFSTPQNADAATVTTTDIGTAIVQAAAKYLGYGYSQSSRYGTNGTFDCSGLVSTVLKDAGVSVPSTSSVSGTPSTTAAWTTWFSEVQDGKIFTYDGKSYKVKTASTLDDFVKYKNDSKYAGYAIVLTSAANATDVAANGLSPGAIMVGDGHASIVADVVKPNITKYTAASVGNNETVAKVLNQIQYQEQVHDYFYSTTGWNFGSLTSSKAYLSCTDSNTLDAIQKHLTGIGSSLNVTSMMKES
jgi:cell wall-associated NlpC family hydrolase